MPLKRNVADVFVVGLAGPSWSVVSGAVVSAASIVHVYSAAGLSVMLCPFSGSVVALTSKTCSPLERSYSYGDVHGSNGSTSGSTASRRHSYVEPGWSKNDSSPVALVLISPAGTSVPTGASFVMVRQRRRDDVPGVARRLGVGEERLVDRAHLERVLPAGEVGNRVRRRAADPRVDPVEPALEVEVRRRSCRCRSR